MFSFRSFMVSHITLKSLIYFELIFMYGVRQWSSFIFLKCGCPAAQRCLLKRLSLIHYMSFALLSQISCLYMCELFPGLWILLN